MTDEKFYSTKESARFLKIDVRTFQRLRKAGKLVPDRLSNNNSVFYSESQLRRFETTDICESDERTAVRSSMITSRILPAAGDFAVGFTEALPLYHFSEVTKLVKKLQEVEFNQSFKTAFNRERTLYTFARLEYDSENISFDRTLDLIDELILNAVYSITRYAQADADGFYPVDGKPVFSSRRVVQHVFGNVPDHFQKETVELIEGHIRRLTFMRLTFDLRDAMGNKGFVTFRGEKCRPVALHEALLDVSVVDFENETRDRKFPVYKLNRKSPIFTYAEGFNQITSWLTYYMAVPCWKTLQNAIIMSYLLEKISLVKNPRNHYMNNGILFETLYSDLKLDVSTRKKSKVIRDNIRVMFEYWKQVGLLESYEFEKIGQKFHKISFKVNMRGVAKC